MQDNVIEIRDQSCVTGGEDPDAVPEALVISLQFLFACAEDREIPVAHKLHDEPRAAGCQRESTFRPAEGSETR